MADDENIKDEVVQAKRVIVASDTRSFWTMVLLAAQNAFNDKAAQTMLIALGVFLVNGQFRLGGGAGLDGDALQMASANASAWVPMAFSALILAPFIFLAPLAGWISDRYSKSGVLKAGALLQVLVLGLIYMAVSNGNFTLAVVGFGLLALQSTLLSPAKKGVVKEMLGSERLGSASGVLELSSVLAICAGQILSGFWFDSRYESSGSEWVAVGWPVLLLMICAVPAFFVSLSIKRYPSPSKRPFKVNILWEHVGQMTDLLGDVKLRLSALAVAFFWFVGGFINIVALQVANQLTSGSGGGMGVELAYLLTSASGGMILGGAFAAYSCRRCIELGLVPIGGILMVAGCSALAFVPVSGDWFKICIGLTGFGASMFLVPLNAHLQDSCSDAKRGKVIAGSNLLDCIAGAMAVGIFYGLLKLGVSINTQFILIALLCVAVTVYATRILPQHFVRFTVLTFLRVFYKQKVLHAERLPSEGGVLIVPNHVTYLDAFILTASSKRPIRFLMYDSYFKKAGLVRFFIKFFDTVPISEKRAKDALQKAADALNDGGVVCIFPEGQLTRSGCMNELKRGFEMIARKAKCPVVPVYMDGLWGSIFSFERGKFIFKWPYRFKYGVTVAWGEPMCAGVANAVSVREELSKLGAECFSHRGELQRPMRSAVRGSVKVLGGDVSAVRELVSEVKGMSESEVRGLVYNALQISDVHAFRRRQTVGLYMDELGDVAHVLAAVLPRVGGLKVVLLDSTTTVEEVKKWHQAYGVSSYFGGGELRKRLEDAGINDVAVYLVDGGEASELLYPMMVAKGRVVAMSMPHPLAVTASNQFQAGWKEEAYGRVLPGYYVEEAGGRDVIYDPQGGCMMEAPVDNQGFMLVGGGD